MIGSTTKIFRLIFLLKTSKNPNSHIFVRPKKGVTIRECDFLGCNY